MRDLDPPGDAKLKLKSSFYELRLSAALCELCKLLCRLLSEHAQVDLAGNRDSVIEIMGVFGVERSWDPNRQAEHVRGVEVSCQVVKRRLCFFAGNRKFLSLSNS